MRGLRITLIMLGITSTSLSLAADNIIVSDNTGKAYLKDNSGNLFPAGVVFTTDGNSNIQPVFSTDSTISIGTVNQGNGNNGSSPWNVIDSAWISDFNTWKPWADVNLSTRAADASIQTLIGKFTNTTGGAVKVDGSAFTQPISGSVSVSNFPSTQPVSGTVTANIGTTGGLSLDTTSQSISTSVGRLPIAQGTALGSNYQVLNGGSVTTSSPTYTTGQINPLSLTTSGALRTDSTATTQPISGTITANAGTGNFTVTQSTGTNLHAVIDSGSITANIGTTNGLALDSSVSKLTIPQGTALGSNTQALIGGSVSTASPAYTTGQISPISLTTAGALRVDASSTTQPISGTIAATQSGTWSTRIQDGNGNLLTSQISGSQRALDVGINVSGTQVDPRSIRALTSSDVVTANIGTTNGLALDTSVNGILVTQGSTTSGEKGPLIQGAVTTSAPTYTTAQTSPLSLTTAGALRVDATSTTQPVSGTVTANAGTGTFTVGQATGTNLHTVVDSGTLAATQSGTWNIANVTNITGTVSLPTGAATASNQTTANSSLSTIATNTTGLNSTIAVTSSAVPADALQIGVKNGSNLVPITEGQATSANSLPVVIASDQSVLTITQGNSTGKTTQILNGSLVTTAVTANQVILTHTVTAGKTFYLQEFDCNVFTTAHTTTAAAYGICSLQIGGTTVWSSYLSGPGSAQTQTVIYSEPIPVSAGTVIQWVTTPVNTTSYTWNSNFGGYEK